MLRFSWGALLIALPRRALRMLGGPTTRPWRTLARVLGARHLAQSVSELRRGSQPSRLGPLVDGLHAGSAVVFGVMDSRHRRSALRDAAIAGAFAVSGAAAFRA